ESADRGGVVGKCLVVYGRYRRRGELVRGTVLLHLEPPTWLVPAEQRNGHGELESRTDGSVDGSRGGRLREVLPSWGAVLEFRGPGILQRRAPERRAGVVGGGLPAGALPMKGAGRQVNRAGRPLLPVKMQVAGLVRNSMPMVTGFVGAPLWELRPSRSGVTDGSRLRLVSSRSRYAR